MTAETSPMQAVFHTSLKEIGEDSWNTFAGTENPFVSFAFLSALEDSGSASAETGWQPYHLTLENADTGALAAVMPLYVKNHSYGEYVFDHAWANAFERAGGRYYPKLQASVPFTPVTGPRLLTQSPSLVVPAAEALKAISERLQVSSLHVTFAEAEEAHQLEAQGFLLRQDKQFHWQNEGYASFDQFLEALASRKRKQIRKERRTALADGFVVKWYSGSDLTEARWDRFYDFYIDTGNRKWGTPYLNRDFFSLIGERMADKILLMMVETPDGREIAGALNFIGETALYGRYWGALEEVPCLHFETCYYQAIDYAIEHGLRTVEAGAQGPHKLARGYVPTATYSAHWITNPGFRDAVAHYLEEERTSVETEMAWISENHTPFKKAER